MKVKEKAIEQNKRSTWLKSEKSERNVVVENYISKDKVKIITMESINRISISREII